MIDINELANEIYSGNIKEEKVVVKKSAPSGNKSDYHNTSLRGEAGLSGEDSACAYLEAHGYKILKRNYRCYSGEIDIIASKDNVLSFVEVKTRSNVRYGLPREAVTYDKQRKIRRSAENYLAMTKRLNNMPPLSFDVIEVIRTGGRIKSINHLKSCF